MQYLCRQLLKKRNFFTSSLLLLQQLMFMVASFKDVSPSSTAADLSVLRNQIALIHCHLADRPTGTVHKSRALLKAYIFIHILYFEL